MNIVFLDTETTGLENGRLVQLAFKKRGDSNILVEYYKPPVSIEFEAMATHHITEKMVANMPAFKSTPTYNNLIEMLKESVLVAHNAPFDISILKNEGIETNTFICTYKVAYRLYDFPNYKLQTLRYRWGFEIENATAHDAAGDVMVLEKVFEYMFNDYCTKNSVTLDNAINDFIDISSKPLLLKQLSFGKYRGMKFEDILKSDPEYLIWMKDKMENKPEDLVFTLNHYLSKQNKNVDESVPF